MTVVQSSGDPARARRLASLADPAGFPVRVRGLAGGAVVDEKHVITSIRRALSTAHEWPQIAHIVAHEPLAILSNTGDDGFVPRPADDATHPSQAMSYPAKLFHLLAGRFEAGGAPLPIFPLELVSGNGAVLRRRVLDIAAARGASADLVAWLESCLWANSLVDRIVSAPIEFAGAVAEPYALWEIEAQPGLTPPTDHPAIRMVDDLETVERLKLHILNLGHTALAAFWTEAGAPSGTTVRAALAGPPGDRLRDVMQAEVLPGFAARSLGAEAEAYLATTLERFANPFLDHYLTDIAQNHPQKVARRIGAFLEWVRAVAPDHRAPRLDAIAASGDTA